MSNKEKMKGNLSFYDRSTVPVRHVPERQGRDGVVENPSSSERIEANQSIPNEEPPSKFQRLDFDESSLERDPGLCISIQHHFNHRDEIRQGYIKMGPYQPKLKEYPRSIYGKQKQYYRFNYQWFETFKWLEYSPSKDAVFCFPCYLFAKEAQQSIFTVNGFRDWKHVNDQTKCAFLSHVGNSNSVHSNCAKSVVDLMNVTWHIDKVMHRESSEQVRKNRLRLTATIESVRWLSLQACGLRGHGESLDLHNRGNFIEILKLLGKWNSGIGDVILDKAPGNAKYTSPDIQNEILHIIGNRVRNKIRNEIGDSKFCILVDEAMDVSNKENMAIIVRFVDAHGYLREHFLQIVHVPDTIAATLKKGVCDVLSKFNLETHNMCGQAYDGASNMSGAFNGLQALFLQDFPYAYNVHCFAHRLQLALVGAAQKESSAWLFFSHMTTIVNLVTSYSKRNDQLQTFHADEILSSINVGERETGRGANQIGTLQRAGETRWSSHFDSMCSLVDIFNATIKVLEAITIDGSSISMRGEVGGSLIVMKSFDFIFILHLMHKIMGITDILCRALQQKSLDIVNAMTLVGTTNDSLKLLRAEGFDILLSYVESFCATRDIDIPIMSAYYKHTNRSCQEKDVITVEHHYHYDIFNDVIDYQWNELDSRFNDKAKELLMLSTALDPRDNFKSFDKGKICTLAEKYYPEDFARQEIYHLRCKLQHYELDVILHKDFKEMSTVSELCRVLFETRKAQCSNLIDRLIRLVLTLPISTTTTERAFSAMKLVKTVLRNKMGEDFLADL